MQPGVLISILSEYIEDLLVEEEAKYLVGGLDRDVARQVIYTSTVWSFDLHRLVVR